LLIGPKQVGKTTLVNPLSQNRPQRPNA